MTGFTRYGYYRYGYSEYRPDDRTEDWEVPDEGLSELDLFGAGVALRSSDDPEGVPWDFVVDKTGDLAATAGQDELRKDMAFGTARDGQSLVGTLSTSSDRTRFERDIERVGRRDSRVNSVDAAVKPRRRVPNMVDAEVEVDADTENLPRMVIPMKTR